MPRVPLSEVLIAEQRELELDAPAAARREMERWDEQFVERALSLGVRSGVVLDLGTGAGQIAIKVAQREPGFIVHGSDASDAILHWAALDAVRWGVGLRLLFDRCDAVELPYDSGLFDLVLCNCVLHQVRDPAALVREMGRVAKTAGALLLRDYARPGRIDLRWHLRRCRSAFEGRLRELLELSLRASYTLGELREIVNESGISGVRVSRYSPIHIGFERRTR
jgi:ubiquinone/menaquinone biosynthesis C-methylase UbiE